MANGKNSVDEALEAAAGLKATTRSKKHSDDLAAWQAWKAKPSPTTLQASMKRHDGLLNVYMAKYVSPGVSQEAARGKLQNLLYKAHTTYDPSRGTTPQTHFENSLKRINRLNERGQNMARIPPDKQQYIGPISTARAALQAANGESYTPTHEDVVNWLLENKHVLGKKPVPTVKKVETVSGLIRKDVAASKMEHDGLSIVPSMDRQHFPLIREKLKPQGQQVFDHLFGYNNKPQISSKGGIAKAVGISAPAVSREITNIANLYKKHF